MSTEILIEVKQVECTECGGPVWGVIRTGESGKAETLAREHYKTKAAKAAHDARPKRPTAPPRSCASRSATA